MKNAITISEFIYLGEVEGNNFNATVCYSKGGKDYMARIYIDYYSKNVYFPKQPKYFKVLHGLDHAVRIEKQFI
jgi:hypothetical protein